jgi:hypothetical protein
VEPTPGRYQKHIHSKGVAADVQSTDGRLNRSIAGSVLILKNLSVVDDVGDTSARYTKYYLEEVGTSRFGLVGLYISRRLQCHSVYCSTSGECVKTPVYDVLRIMCLWTCRWDKALDRMISPYPTPCCARMKRKLVP